ncbi:MAG: cyclic lactone autoinducer peptide [Clostridiales bacterium]|nr:cyclic lactone autoinducer peptide [uncultured Anaerosporobacter sp.]MBS5934712.1 cyclic lactone autoinducer peptide [Clostridiales bacterium]
MKKVLNTVAKVGLNSAKSASSKSSWWGCYQPQEPVELKKLKK